MKSCKVTSVLRGLSTLVLFFACLGFGQAQTAPFSLMPVPQQCFTGPGGAILSGGFIGTYQTGTTTPAPTYTDSSGLYLAQNPINLDANGCAQIWLGPIAYTITAFDANMVQQWSVNNVSDVGQILYTKAVLLNPAARAQQTVAGPLGADYFIQNTAHFTSPGLRVNMLDPYTILDTPNAPAIFTVDPAFSSGGVNQQYVIPDPKVRTSNFVISPGPVDWLPSNAYALPSTVLPYLNNPCAFTFQLSTAGTSSPTEPIWSTQPCPTTTYTVSDGSAVWGSLGIVARTNVLDCTASGITCIRNAYVWFEGAGCNNSTAALGWDTFASNAPTPICLTGTNVQKGVMALPSAATILQQNTGNAAPATTVTVTYPAATTTGDLLVAEVAVDGSQTVSGCTDGTNAYTRAANKTNGALDLEIWYFNGNSTGMAAASTLTCTLSASANAAINWKEYNGILTSSMLDRTANASGSGTAVTTGTTVGTSQAVELVLGAMGALSNAGVTGQNGWVRHNVAQSGTSVEVASEGLIQQAAAAQLASFTLGSSSTWAGLIVTFKANVGAAVTAQRSWGLPSFYQSSMPVLSTIKYQLSQNTTGSGTARLGVSSSCTADGSTDDPAFNTPTLTSIATPLPSPNVVETVSFPNVPASGCSAGNQMHFEVLRNRYDPLDTFEGWIYVNGASLGFGINQ